MLHASLHPSATSPIAGQCSRRGTCLVSHCSGMLRKLLMSFSYHSVNLMSSSSFCSSSGGLPSTSGRLPVHQHVMQSTSLIAKAELLPRDYAFPCTAMTWIDDHSGTLRPQQRIFLWALSW